VTEKKKALLLLSGGLDSTIAMVMMKEHNIDVEAVHFTSLSLLTGNSAKKYLEFACGVTSRYGDVEDKAKKVKVRAKDLATSEENIIEVMTAQDSDFTGALL
jgi:tRNA U34 2-thiouridine synthase MnmA/TrmU